MEDQHRIARIDRRPEDEQVVQVKRADRTNRIEKPWPIAMISGARGRNWKEHAKHQANQWNAAPARFAFHVMAHLAKGQTVKKRTLADRLRMHFSCASCRTVAAGSPSHPSGRSTYVNER